MEVKLYIFDMGGVLVQNFDVQQDIYEELNINEEEFYKYAGDEWGKYYDGQITSDEFWQGFSKRYGQNITEDLFAKYFRPEIDPQTQSIIERLKNKNRVVCGTNTFDSHYDYLFLNGYYNIFDRVYASNKIGISKPDPEFYRYILEKEKVRPAEAVFIDDMEENVVAAREVGLKAILFTGPEVLEKLIHEL